MELEAYCALCGVPFDVYADLYRQGDITPEAVAWTKYFIACELACLTVVSLKVTDTELQYAKQKTERTRAENLGSCPALGRMMVLRVSRVFSLRQNMMRGWLFNHPTRHLHQLLGERTQIGEI